MEVNVKACMYRIPLTVKSLTSQASDLCHYEINAEMMTKGLYRAFTLILSCLTLRYICHRGYRLCDNDVEMVVWTEGNGETCHTKPILTHLQASESEVK